MIISILGKGLLLSRPQNALLEALGSHIEDLDALIVDLGCSDALAY